MSIAMAKTDNQFLFHSYSVLDFDIYSASGQGHSAAEQKPFYTILSTSYRLLRNNDYSNFVIWDPNVFPTDIDSFFILLNNAIGNNTC